jgi:hypothetical protein
MSNMVSMTEAFVDEFEKISAAKCRRFTTPIRASNLADRQVVDKTTGQLKTAAVPKPKSLIGKPAKTLAMAAGGVAAWETGKQALRDFQLGRAIRKQQEQRR